MDEAVWVVIGIVGVFLGIGVLGSLLLQSDGDRSFNQVEVALQVLSAQCEQVCAAPENSAISVGVALPSDAVLFTEGERVCAELEGAVRCERCRCTHVNKPVVLNLTGAGAFFNSREFSCRYTRVETGNTDRNVTIECAG